MKKKFNKYKKIHFNISHFICLIVFFKFTRGCNLLYRFRFDLTHFGEKYSEQEANDFMEQITMDDNGKFNVNEICDLMCGKSAEEEEEAPKEG